MITCDEALVLVSARLDSELSGFEQRALDAHLQACPACRAEARASRRLEDVVPSQSVPPAPSELRACIEAALARQGAERRLWDYVMTARGRTLVEQKGESLWQSQPKTYPLSRLRT
jgi:predicted anti-sigma-YlaC factor YlaD